MKNDVIELMFVNRSQFRDWLINNSETSEGVWLVFSKTKTVKTISANEALEEALCFGWIDGQMKSIDDTKYIKYLARRRNKSIWSQKNKKMVEELRAKGLMTEIGEKAIEAAKKSGAWDDPLQNLTDAQIDDFGNKFIGIMPAYENFNAMSLSKRKAIVRWYYSVKSEELRQRNLMQIIDSLNNNIPLKI